MAARETEKTEKVAIVTAGGSGMGAATARKLGEQGFHLAILSSSGKGEALAAELGLPDFREPLNIPIYGGEDRRVGGSSQRPARNQLFRQTGRGQRFSGRAASLPTSPSSAASPLQLAPSPLHRG